MLAFKNVFQVNNRDSLYGEACINNLYGDISNYLYSAITSKALLSEKIQIFPNTYYIEFNSTENTIRFSYDTWWWISTWKDFSLASFTGNVTKNYNCKTNAYNIWLSWTNLQIKINKWLTEDANLQSMSLSGEGIGSNTFTGAIKFLLYYPNSTWYKELWRFEIDIRTQSIKSKMCLSINNTWDCNNRNQ